MPIRLWNQSVTELRRDSSYSKALVNRAQILFDGEVSVDTFGLPPGSYEGGQTASALISNAYVFHQMMSHFIDQAVRAEREGYDAFIVGTFADPFVTEIRAAVDIPVLSALETSLLVGCTLGQKVALVTTSPNVIGMIRRSIDTYQLGARVSDVVAVDPPLLGPELHGSFEAPAASIERFERAARAVLANGADVLVPAEGILAVMLAERGYSRFENAPVLDVYGATWGYAQMLVNLRKRAGIATSRRGRYQQPNAEFIASLKGRVAAT